MAAELVVLIGPAGSGKSTIVRRCPAEMVLSSDGIRRELCGDESNQAVTSEAFALLHHRADERARSGLSTIVDATNAERAHRRELLAIAERHGIPAIAIVLNVAVGECQRRIAGRERRVPAEVVAAQHSSIVAALEDLHSEGFTTVRRYPDGFSGASQQSIGGSERV